MCSEAVRAARTGAQDLSGRPGQVLRGGPGGPDRCSEAVRAARTGAVRAGFAGAQGLSGRPGQVLSGRPGQVLSTQICDGGDADLRDLMFVCVI